MGLEIGPEEVEMLKGVQSLDFDKKVFGGGLDHK